MQLFYNAVRAASNRPRPWLIIKVKNNSRKSLILRCDPDPSIKAEARFLSALLLSQPRSWHVVPSSGLSLTATLGLSHCVALATRAPLLSYILYRITLFTKKLYWNQRKSYYPSW